MSADEVLQILFFGKVQGVGFRRRVKDHADALNLKGTVRNQAEGSVEVIVGGPTATIQTFLNRIDGDFARLIQSKQVASIQRELTPGFKIIL